MKLISIRAEPKPYDLQELLLSREEWELLRSILRAYYGGENTMELAYVSLTLYSNTGGTYYLNAKVESKVP